MACEEELDKKWKPTYKASDYGIIFTGDWTSSDQSAAMQQVAAIADVLSDYGWYASNSDPDADALAPSQVFKKVFGQTEIRLNATGGLGCQRAGFGFECGAGTGGRLHEYYQGGLIIHEFGHVFNARIANNDHALTPYNLLGQTTIVDDLGRHVTGLDNGVFTRTDRGYRPSDDPQGWGSPYQQHSLAMGDGNNTHEDFADMFLNWTYNSFADDSAGRARYNWMASNMALWVSQASHPYP